MDCCVSSEVDSPDGFEVLSEVDGCAFSKSLGSSDDTVNTLGDTSAPFFSGFIHCFANRCAKNYNLNICTHYCRGKY